MTIMYKNTTNGYTVLLLKVGTEYVNAVGETEDIEVGDKIEIEGEYTTHKTYGEQFSFVTYTKVMPSDNETLIQYISDNVKGIGKKTAERIVITLGDTCIEDIKTRPYLLENIKGLAPAKIEALTDFFNTEWEKWNVIKYLSSFSMSVVTANKIFQTLGPDTINIVKQNPYSLLEFVRTLDFKNVDEIGLKIGIEYNNFDRLCSGVIYAISTITEFGHTCIEKDVLVNYTSKLLGVLEEEILSVIDKMKFEEKIFEIMINDITYISRRAYYIAEKNIASSIMFHTKQDTTKKSYKKEIENVSEEESLVLSDEQINAIETALNSPICVITGGPGTGKTTIIKCIINIIEKMDKEYLLAAPTGRAAKRIQETTKKEAKTLHRLLEITKLDDKDLDSFLDYVVKPIDKDYLIIDEASMIDTLMMNNIFKSVKAKTKIIFVGDVDQLPSVGSGSVLKDVIDSNTVSTIYLKKIYRQSSMSDIILNAHSVNNGEYPTFKSKETDLFFIPTSSIEDTINEIKSLVSYRLENFANLDSMKDLQVLTPMKKQDLGTYSLNKILQDILNPKSSKKVQKELNGRIFRVGDKVMQVVNNYDKKFSQDGKDFEGVFNGDIGYISEIDKDAETLTVTFEDEKKVEYLFNEADELELAYAITVHKSQGSEFDYVVLPIFSGYKKLFTRNLLYTAMTRAKKMLIIVGSKKMINNMVDNIEEKDRKTGLKQHILNLV